MLEIDGAIASYLSWAIVLTVRQRGRSGMLHLATPPLMGRTPHPVHPPTDSSLEVGRCRKVRLLSRIHVSAEFF